MPFGPAFSTPGRFFKGNIHTHSNRSDGALTPEEVCRRYREAGYDFLALTDHFLPQYEFPIVDTQPFRTENFTIPSGGRGPRTADHARRNLAYPGCWASSEISPTPAHETGAALAQRCIDAGAFVAIPHPGWYALTAEDAATLPNAHAVEIYNHTSHVRADRGDGAYLVEPDARLRSPDQSLRDGRCPFPL